MKQKLPLLLAVLSIAFWNCTGPLPEDPAADPTHSHDGTTHTHADEETSVSVTVWTDDLELFMEYPVLRVGRPAKLAVHLTKLKDFQPLSEGPVLFQFTRTGAAPKMVTVGSPEVPGIFGPSITFDEAGSYTMRLEILSDELETSLEYGPISVVDEDADFAATPESPAGQTISFLKEQQWKFPFASAVATEREMQETLRIPAKISAKTGLQSIVSPAVGGKYVAPETGLPRLGSRVGRDQLLGYLELLPAERSSLLDSQMSTGISMSRLVQDAAQAEALVSAEQARFALAEKEAKRVSALVDAEALPTRRLDEAQSELQIRRVSLQAAEEALQTYRAALSRFDQAGNSLTAIEGRLPLRAPVSGQLVEVHAVPGQFVDTRENLFRIVDLSLVWAEGQAFENDLPKLEDLKSGTLKLPGLEAITLPPSSLVMVGSILDPSTRTLPVVFEVENSNRRIKLGMLGQLELQSGSSLRTLAVPRSAVLLEENRSVVYLHLEGETFERRPVTTGVEDREWVQILEGLRPGERIVTLGAYDVALAGRSTEVPEHGHVH